jgi:putative Mn2+ efflux pump MntP
MVEGIRELKGNVDEQPKVFHSFTKVLIVSFATSLDAFAVGVSLGVSDKSLIPYIISIGLWAFSSTIVGMSIAKFASKKAGPILGFIGALVLLILAFKFLIEGL